MTKYVVTFQSLRALIDAKAAVAAYIDVMKDHLQAEENAAPGFWEGRIADTRAALACLNDYNPVHSSEELTPDEAAEAPRSLKECFKRDLEEYGSAHVDTVMWRVQRGLGMHGERSGLWEITYQKGARQKRFRGGFRDKEKAIETATNAVFPAKVTVLNLEDD